MKLEKMASERRMLSCSCCCSSRRWTQHRQPSPSSGSCSRSGTVERVTDLALLEKVGEKKREELGKSVVSGDSIAFGISTRRRTCCWSRTSASSWRWAVLAAGHNGAGK